MATILNIETSTDVCSVALTRDGEVVEHRENYDGHTHSTLLNVFIDEMLRYAKTREIAIDAIAVSIGPGSYTGLRIGLSEAKGLAFGLNVPLIGINTLKLMTVSVMFSEFYDDEVLYAPMIDARRMEVYTAVYNQALEEQVEPASMIVDEDSFKDLLEKTKIVFFGNGSDKVEKVLLNGEDVTNDSRYFVETGSTTPGGSYVSYDFGSVKGNSIIQIIYKNSRYDVNRDGRATISDVTKLVNRILGKE